MSHLSRRLFRVTQGRTAAVLMRFLAMGSLFILTSLHLVAAEPRPWTAKDQTQLQSAQLEKVARLDQEIERTPAAVDLYSQRGDALFFAGEFSRSFADYEKMVELDSELATSHWRRGIAAYYAGKYEAAAQQFEQYHSFDDVDRENGIWRYLSQYRAYGAKKAAEGLLKYTKDDREPMKGVYQLIADRLTPAELINQIETAKIDEEARDLRLFYAHLYIGLKLDVEGKPADAVPHLQAATASTWGRNASYGPRYMWHVGRVHLLQLEEKLAAQKAPK